MNPQYVDTALLFGIFYRMGVFNAALDALTTRVKHLERKHHVSQKPSI